MNINIKSTREDRVKQLDSLTEGPSERVYRLQLKSADSIIEHHGDCHEVINCNNCCCYLKGHGGRFLGGTFTDIDKYNFAVAFKEAGAKKALKKKKETSNVTSFEEVKYGSIRRKRS